MTGSGKSHVFMILFCDSFLTVYLSLAAEELGDGATQLGGRRHWGNTVLKGMGGIVSQLLTCQGL